MKKFRVICFISTLVFALSGCGIFWGSDSTDVSVAEDVAAQPTVNSVQSVPAQTPEDSSTDAGAPADGDAAGSALPTAVTLPTAAPTPEPTVDRSQPTTYVVKSGDVLGLIAERFDADIAELRRINNLEGNLIRVGQQLTIPAADGSTSTGSGSSGSGETASGSGSATPAPAATRAPATTVTCSSSSGHCIQPGESLLGIALKFDVSVEALRAANPSIVGDLIRAGAVLTIPGSSGPAPAGTAVPPTTAGPANDADCKARNADFPYFHASDGLCYANPIGATTIPTAVGASDVECPAGRFLWEDGLCYAIPGVTVTPTAGPTPTTAANSLPDYGTTPCRTGYLPLVSGRCWPEPATTPATVTPVAAAATSTTTGTGAGTGNTVACADPNFVQSGSGSGTCFLLQAGLDKGCSVQNGVPKCP